MNDNEPWPVMGQAVASRAARILAQYATWQLTACAPYHGLPLAGFLQDEAAALLLAVTNGSLHTSSAAMRGSLIEMRSDGLIIGTRHSCGLPQIALGLWCRGHVTWHRPMLPWLSTDETMWLVPIADACGRPQAYKLIPRHLRGDVLPWRTKRDRYQGFARAAGAFAGGE